MISDDSLNISTKVITKNGVNYYNVSNWCKQVGKKSKTYSSWKRTDDAKDKIRVCLEESGLDEVIIDISDVKNELKGMYVYDKLAIFIAMWIDNELGIRVAKLINEGIKRQLDSKYESVIREKDRKIEKLNCKIDELRRQLDEVLRDTKRPRFPTFRRAKQVLRENQVIHSKLDQLQEEISAKLDKVTDMISDMKTN